MRVRVSREMQAELNRQDQLRDLDRGSHGADTFQYFSLMHIFIFKHFLEKRNVPILSSLLSYIFLPMTALASVATALLAWRRVMIGRYEGESVARAVVETFSAGALIAAAVGLLVSAVTFAFVAPVILAAVVATKAVFNMGLAIHFGWKARQAVNEADKAVYREKVKYAVIDAACGGVIAGALLTMVLVAAPAVQFAMMVVGVLASTVAFAYCRMKMDYPAERYQSEWAEETSSSLADTVAATRTNNANLAQTFGVSSQGAIIERASPVAAFAPPVSNDAALAEHAFVSVPAMQKMGQ